MPPLSGLSDDARLRAEIVAVLRGGNAHVGTAQALAGIPPSRVHERPAGAAHSLYSLVWHLRFTNADILAFCSPGYADKAWPDDYWPDAPGDDWDVQLRALFADLDAFEHLAESGDLFAEFAWAPGYTLLRELLLVADHTAHHLGQIVALRRRLGLWP